MGGGAGYRRVSGSGCLPFFDKTWADYGGGTCSGRKHSIRSPFIRSQATKMLRGGFSASRMQSRQTDEKILVRKSHVCHFIYISCRMKRSD